jgi:lipoprotein signal peptidase
VFGGPRYVTAEKRASRRISAARNIVETLLGPAGGGAMSRSHGRAAGALSTVFAVVFADQFAKGASTHFRAAAVVPVRNPGMITGWSPVSVSALIAVSVVVLVIFVGIVGRWAVQLDISPLIPALVCGGLVAHTIDRIRFGAVRDFIATGWLIIDVGDLAVIAGLVALAAAFVLRVVQLRRSAQTVQVQLPRLRAVIVAREVRNAA